METLCDISEKLILKGKMNIAEFVSELTDVITVLTLSTYMSYVYTINSKYTMPYDKLLIALIFIDPDGIHVRQRSGRVDPPVSISDLLPVPKFGEDLFPYLIRNKFLREDNMVVLQKYVIAYA